MKKMLLSIFCLLLSLPLIKALTSTVTQGSITDLGMQTILVDFGMIKGTINFKLGDYRWPPKEIWLIPESMEIEHLGNFKPSDYFKSTGNYLEIPENLTFSTCKTSIYFNQSLGYAFKILNSNSQILENGTFCGLAYEGNYKVVARY